MGWGEALLMTEVRKDISVAARIRVYRTVPLGFSPDKLSLNGNREASRDVSFGDSLILPGTGNSMWKAVDSP